MAGLSEKEFKIIALLKSDLIHALDYLQYSLPKIKKQCEQNRTQLIFPSELKSFLLSINSYCTNNQFLFQKLGLFDLSRVFTNITSKTILELNDENSLNRNLITFYNLLDRETKRLAA